MKAPPLGSEEERPARQHRLGTSGEVDARDPLASLRRLATILLGTKPGDAQSSPSQASWPVTPSVGLSPTFTGPEVFLKSTPLFGSQAPSLNPAGMSSQEASIWIVHGIGASGPQVETQLEVLQTLRFAQCVSPSSWSPFPLVLCFGPLAFRLARSFGWGVRGARFWVRRFSKQYLLERVSPQLLARAAN